MNRAKRLKRAARARRRARLGIIQQKPVEVIEVPKAEPEKVKKPLASFIEPLKETEEELDSSEKAKETEKTPRRKRSQTISFESEEGHESEGE